MARKKTADLLAAKQRKKKIIAIVGAVVLVGVLAIQVPRTLKMLNPPQTVSSAEAAARDEENQPEQATPPVSFQTGTGGDAAATPPASGQLISFERFAVKDPFVQQISASKEGGSSSKQSGSGPSKKSKGKKKTAKPRADKLAGAGRGSGAAGSGKPESQAPSATSTVISINGANETIAAGTTFPATEKIFRLISVTTGSAKIGVVGGTFGNGAETLTLERGKARTIMNTASGAEYVLRLVSTG